MQNINNLRQHVVLAIVTLVVAAVLLALTFIPRQPVMIQGGGPDGGNQIIGPTNFSSSSPFTLAADPQLVSPLFTLSAS
ncbi:hypothetical protein KSF_042310 [Reticulibacter mediterranei]|uniref:Uncharacterized protein n=1 Tax=Reticulibacter mediterranei TaxID=2778369 RepID=A0A8J3IKN2_9CHLR|nr:hypothetical protein [Reticulibacter mediterranei]GHO94183.1 hypothetical protein KSF_042310 [Reticulibacter mediterranei]